MLAVGGDDRHVHGGKCRWEGLMRVDQCCRSVGASWVCGPDAVKEKLKCCITFGRCARDLVGKDALGRWGERPGMREYWYGPLSQAWGDKVDIHLILGRPVAVKQLPGPSLPTTDGTV